MAYKNPATDNKIKTSQSNYCHCCGKQIFNSSNITKNRKLGNCHSHLPHVALLSLSSYSWDAVMDLELPRDNLGTLHRGMVNMMFNVSIHWI